MQAKINASSYDKTSFLSKINGQRFKPNMKKCTHNSHTRQ